MFLPSQWMKWLKGCGRGSPQRVAIFSFLLLQAEKGRIYFASPWMNLDLPQLAAYGRSDVGPVLDLAIKRPTLGLVKASHHDRNFTTLRSPCSDTAQSSLMERPWGRAPRHQICEWRLRQQLNAAEFVIPADVTWSRRTIQMNLLEFLTHRIVKNDKFFLSHYIFGKEST